MSLLHNQDVIRISQVNVVIPNGLYVLFRSRENVRPICPTYFRVGHCQIADGVCFMRQDRCADGGNHATRDRNNTRSVLQNTKKLSKAIHNKRVECCHPV
jgi:hypothetical protein